MLERLRLFAVRERLAKMLVDDRRGERLADERGFLRHVARLRFDPTTGDDAMAPTATPIMVGCLPTRAKTVEPHVGQKNVSNVFPSSVGRS